MRRRPPSLGEKLEELAARYGREHLESDPVKFPHRYQRCEDREVVAFLASALAYGSVPQICRGVERVLEVFESLGPSPASVVDQVAPEEIRRRLGGFRHRFNDARDVAACVAILGEMRRRHGSIEGFFAEGAPPGSPLRRGLSSFVRRALALGGGRLYGTQRKGELPPNAGVRFFFSDPADGSACKRLCMFLRWVARPGDGVDLGLWTCLPPSALVMPLDTHTTRLCHWNGLCPSPFATWSNAEKVTAALRRYDPNDPVRFDFALSRLGILRVPPHEARVRVPTRA